MNNLDKYKKDIKILIKNGETIIRKIKKNIDLAKQRENYEIWYSEALNLIKIILPDRLEDFKKSYYDEKRKKGLKMFFQYTPPISEERSIYFSDYIPPEQCDLAKSVFEVQLAIVKSCERRFESSLFDIKQLLQADLFDSEIKTAEELNKKGFVRGAGAIAGVVLESHLSQICSNHKIIVKKKNPTINDFNDLLKSDEIIDISVFRNIQLLGDLRNKCDHKKEKNPTKEEIEKLIDGVNEIIKTVL